MIASTARFTTMMKAGFLIALLVGLCSANVGSFASPMDPQSSDVYSNSEGVVENRLKMPTSQKLFAERNFNLQAAPSDDNFMEDTNSDTNINLLKGRSDGDVDLVNVPSGDGYFYLLKGSRGGSFMRTANRNDISLFRGSPGDTNLKTAKQNGYINKGFFLDKNLKTPNRDVYLTLLKGSPGDKTLKTANYYEYIDLMGSPEDNVMETSVFDHPDTNMKVKAKRYDNFMERSNLDRYKKSDWL